MAISVFPAGGGEFITNDFVIDMNNTDNNVIDLGRTYAAGAYEITFATEELTYDLYAVSEDGESVGYTNTSTLITSAGFTQIAILGVSTDQRITFAFTGSSTNANAEGTSVGAGAYIESISPSDLPNQDDTANVIGGNFADDVEVYFESGTVSASAKNIVRTDSTALIVTRPDVLSPAIDPYDVRVVNPGVPEPTATGDNILSGTVTAGTTPSWVTTSPLPYAELNGVYAATVVATDADGSVSYAVSAGTLPAGLSLNGSTGVISGTATAAGDAFTLQATDEGGNQNTREFVIPTAKATGGTISATGNYIVHTFTTSGDFIPAETITDVEYLVVAGGAAGGSGDDTDGRYRGGGGGAGGLRSSIDGESSGGGAASENKVNVNAQTYTITVGAGGTGTDNRGNNGGASTFGNLVATVGGGGGAAGAQGNAASGGSGGGACRSDNSGRGNGTVGEGFRGGGSSNNSAGGGGGASAIGGFPTGGAGLTSSATGTAVTYATGGTGQTNTQGASGFGFGGNGRGANAARTPGFDGSDGVVIVRYE